MSSKAPPSEAVMKQRIISHMNADHIDSVQRYVENYGKVSRFASRSARMTDISLAQMTISAGGKLYHIPFSPPMKAFSEARPRVVEMDQECLKSLDRSPYTVKKYKLPLGFHAFIFALCLSVYIMLLREQHVLPGSIAYEGFLRWIPYFPYIAKEFRLPILGLMVFIHVTETYFMSTKLKKHSVPLFSRVWWLYMGSCFIEGIGSFQRLNAVVEETRIAKEKIKH